MTIKELEEKLNEMFKEKEYEGYNGGTTKIDIVSAIKEQLGISQDDYDTITWGDYKTYIYVKYLGIGFATIDIHKRKGDYKKGWVYSAYKWYVKSLDFNISEEEKNKDVKDIIKEIKDINYKNVMAKREYKQFALTVFKHLLDQYGLEEYETMKVCEYIQKNYWTLREELKKEVE